MAAQLKRLVLLLGFTPLVCSTVAASWQDPHVRRRLRHESPDQATTSSTTLSLTTTTTAQVESSITQTTTATTTDLSEILASETEEPEAWIIPTASLDSSDEVEAYFQGLFKSQGLVYESDPTSTTSISAPTTSSAPVPTLPSTLTAVIGHATTSAVTRTTVVPVSPTAPTACYLSSTDCRQYYASPKTASAKASGFCKISELKTATAVGPGMREVGMVNDGDGFTKIAWYIKVAWKKGCVIGGDGTMNVMEPVSGYTCDDAMKFAFDACNNGGRGGAVDVGCLEYSFSPINVPWQDDCCDEAAYDTGTQ